VLRFIADVSFNPSPGANPGREKGLADPCLFPKKLRHLRILQQIFFYAID
jgi:hypothetical protein